jgi:hypothetical protein
LALNREVFLSIEDDCEYIVHYSFPCLRVLFMLIDDGSDCIEKIWNIEEGRFYTYEDDWPQRDTFTDVCTSPYTDVSMHNLGYVRFIKDDSKKRFRKNEEEYEDYVAPLVVCKDAISASMMILVTVGGIREHC